MLLPHELFEVTDIVPLLPLDEVILVEVEVPDHPEGKVQV